LLGGRSDDYRGMETFPCPTDVDRVEMKCDEVTALCPITGNPDMYDVKIVYWPEGSCLESKSLKYYLKGFRQEGLFVESLAQRILADVCEACRPHECTVEVVQKSRGGISITVVAEKSR
jgi:7-cyano-7-deazaguanine reductase